MGAQGSKQSSSSSSGEVIDLPRSKLCSFRRGASKKQRDAGRSASPLSDGSSSAQALHGLPRGHSRSAIREVRAPTPHSGRAVGQTTGAEMKTPSRKLSTRRNVTSGAQKSSALRDHYRLAPNGLDPASTPVKQLSTEPTKLVSSRAATAVPALSAPGQGSAPRVLAASPTVTAVTAPSVPPVPPVPPVSPSHSAIPAAPASSAVSNALAAPAAPETPALTSSSTLVIAACQNGEELPPPQFHPSLELETVDNPIVPVSLTAPGNPTLTVVGKNTLQETLRQFTLGFDTLAVVLQHTIKKFETLRKCEKCVDCDKTRKELEYNKLVIEENKETITRLENDLHEESNKCKLLSLKEEEIMKCNEKLLEEKLNLERETAITIAAIESKCENQVKLIHSQLATEQDAHQSQILELEKSLIDDFSEKHDAVRKEHELYITQMQTVFVQQEEQLKSEIFQLKEDNERTKKQLSIFMDAENKDSRLQASLCRCGELEEEVRSLQSVLELRHQELQELRKNNCSLTRQAEQLPSALQRITALEARVEDLEAQLKEKCELERQTSQQQSALVEALQKEVNQKNRLTLLNEELQWKLKQNSEVFSALAAMNGSSNSQVPSTSGASSPSVSRKNANGSLHSISEAASSVKGECDPLSRISVSLMKRVNYSHQSLRPEVDDDIVSSPPSSPKIKGIVEKNDSVSWVLDMEESSEELVSRLVRRAGSFRGPTPPPSGLLLNTQTLPSSKRRIKANCLSVSSSSSSVYRKCSTKNDNSRSCIEQCEGRSAHFGSSRSRSHSVSADSMDSMDIINWGINLSDSYNDISENNCTVSSQEKKMLRGLKVSDDESFHNPIDMVLSNNLSTEFQKHPCENGEQNWNCNLSDFCNDESPSKSSGSSAYTSSDEDMRHNIDVKNIDDQNYCSSEKTSHLQTVLPFNSVNICSTPNTADLSLLAACAAAQPALIPKDAAGEAMVSEETSEDENDQDEVDDKDETLSSSITRSASENEEEEVEEEDDDEAEEEEGQDDCCRNIQK